MQWQEQELSSLEQERQRILGRLQQPQPPALKSVIAVPQGVHSLAAGFIHVQSGNISPISISGPNIVLLQWLQQYPGPCLGSAGLEWSCRAACFFHMMPT